MVGEKRDRKDGARDLDLYSAIVAPSSTGSQPFLPTNSCLLIPPVAYNLPFHPPKPRTRRLVSRRNRPAAGYIAVIVMSMKVLWNFASWLYTFGDSTVSLSLYIYIYVYVYSFVYTTSKRYCAFFSCEIRMKGYIARTREYSFKKGYFRLRFLFLNSLPN